MKYVDLFAGCGGLSLGIERAGGDLLLAVEKSEMAARTFAHNLVVDAADPREWARYVEQPVDAQVSNRLLVRPLSDLLAAKHLVEDLGTRDLDLVVGGPPCQGFSLAGRRNPDDVRNSLPWEYLRFVELVHPKFVVIENVVGMNRSFAAEEDSSFVQLQQALATTGSGYIVQPVHVNAVHYGAPQHRPRLMIIGVRTDVARRLGIQAGTKTWYSAFTDQLDEPLPALAPVPTIRKDASLTVRAAIHDLSSVPEDCHDESNLAYRQALSPSHWPTRNNAGTRMTNHVHRRHRARTQTRFRLYQFMEAHGLDQRLVSKVADLTELEARLVLKREFIDVAMPACAPDGTVLAASVDELSDLVMSLATKKHSQKVLPWGKAARTVVTLPDDYVHPSEPRVFTVRELARFQGFPDHFEFVGKETTGSDRRRLEVPQYSQVGNAVSPWLSWAVGKRIRELLAQLPASTVDSESSLLPNQPTVAA